MSSIDLTQKHSERFELEAIQREIGLCGSELDENQIHAQ